LPQIETTALDRSVHFIRNHMALIGQRIHSLREEIDRFQQPLQDKLGKSFPLWPPEELWKTEMEYSLRNGFFLEGVGFFSGDTVMHFLGRLTEREREVFFFRFGLEGGCAHSREETAGKFCISAAVVGRIEAKAMQHYLTHQRHAAMRKEFFDSSGK